MILSSHSITAGSIGVLFSFAATFSSLYCASPCDPVLTIIIIQ